MPLTVDMYYDGEPLAETTEVKPKAFGTGSKGFYRSMKVEIEGQRYQVNLQFVRIGSKNEQD